MGLLPSTGETYFSRIYKKCGVALLEKNLTIHKSQYDSIKGVI